MVTSLSTVHTSSRGARDIHSGWQAGSHARGVGPRMRLSRAGVKNTIGTFQAVSAAFAGTYTEGEEGS